MNLQMHGAVGGLLAALTAMVSIVVTIFWIVVGWRAMRAHEEIARVLRERWRE